jgi:phenylalanyl-tRNA synthetase beta chain
MMRPSILPNLALAAKRNADRGIADAALFELGPQFSDTAVEGQRLVAAGIRSGMTGLRHWAASPRAADAFDAKADVLAMLTALGQPTDALQAVPEAPSWYHPGRSGVLKLGPKAIAYFGELHPGVLAKLDVEGPVAAFEIFFDALPAPRAKGSKARPMLRLSPLQPVERDFAFVVDRTVEAAKLVAAAKGAGRDLAADATITAVSVFDVYEGKGVPEGKKSLAISVKLQPKERTLTDAEIEAIAQRIVAAVTKATGASLRS